MEKVILVAGYDPQDHTALQHAFTEKGYTETLMFVGDVADLLKYLALQKPGGPGFPSTVILDLDMPDKKGWEALRRLKQDPLYRGVHVVMLTTSNNKVESGRCYGLGAHGYIVRPLTTAEFLAAAGYIRGYCYRM